MAFTKKYNEDFIIENSRIKLTEGYFSKSSKRFKKITASRISAILGLSDYNTPAKIWAIMTGIYEDEVDPFFTLPGTIIEEKIRSYYIDNFNVSNKIKTYIPESVGWDVFKDNKIFGGIPDGEFFDEDGKVIEILEIKTTSKDKFKYKKDGSSFILQKSANGLPEIKEDSGNLIKWNNLENFPIEYKLQLSLYMFLRNCTSGIFAVGFLDPEHYLNPQNFTPTSKNTKIYKFKFDKDIFNEAISFCTEWYEKHIMNGISPEITETDYRTWLLIT